MLHTIWVAFAAVVVTIPSALATIIAAMTTSTTSPAVESIIKLWARMLVKAAGIDLHVENVELIKPDHRYILVANHYSYFDIPVIFAAIPQPIRFLAKVSLFKIPIFGWAIARAGFIPIDRKNRRTAVKSFDMAADRIRKGNTIVVFPEEGRSRTREMRPFQRGGFLLALKSQLPIVPIAIDGTFDVFRVGAKRVTPGRVTVKVTEPIPTAGLTLKAKEALANESRARIERLLFGTVSAEPPQPQADLLEEPSEGPA
jgi:1-acyl-sn-glycerol-3-phosphate acyltransferase